MSRVTNVSVGLRELGGVGSATGRVLFIIPAYNEELNLRALLDGAQAQMQRWGLLYRMIIVDDGSTDRTAAIVQQYAASMPIELVRHPRNLGVGAVFRSGIAKALEIAEPQDVVVFKEADNTSDPMVLRQMLVLIEQGNDVVLASCYADGGGVVGTTPSRRLLSAGANLLLRLVFPVRGVHTYSSFYRALRAKTLRAAVEAYQGRLVQEPGFTCAAEMVLKLARLGAAIREVPMVLRCDLTRTPSKQKRLRTILGYLKLFVREGLLRRWSGRAARRRYAEAIRATELRVVETQQVEQEQECGSPA